jgi:hypothetical protein
MQCPASVRLSDPATSPHPELLPPGGGKAATIGTVLHDAFEESVHAGRVVFMAKHGDEIRKAGGMPKEGLALLRDAFSGFETVVQDYDLTTVHTELRVNIGQRFGHDDLWGTSDIVGISGDGQTLAILDLKTGKHRVSADSEQLKLYALGALPLAPNAKQIVLGILQPTVRARADVKVMGMPDLMAFEAQVRTAVELIDAPATKPTPTASACRWCPARTFCPSRGGDASAFDEISAVDFA